MSHFHLNCQVLPVSPEELLIPRLIRCEISRLRCHNRSVLLSIYTGSVVGRILPAAP